ncbi:helix-hairpin-helix domain-containing protein [Chitinivorax sp. PXF-14]|uniref:helix-hairpin-helix domain-containing protein n=1 Tax=Chitinivorax sp. PXF-14 TaxID=3230488 RepID=UPI003465DE7B
MQAALSSFDDSLNRIRDVAKDMETRILAAPPEERLRDETLRCASTVILSGFFESFLKDCTQAYVTAICQRNIPFALLAGKMQSHHFVAGGQLLGQRYRKEGRVSWVKSDHLDIARRLSSPASPGNDYILLWEAYANTEGNPSPVVIDKILDTLGVDQRNLRLDAVTGGKYSTLKLALGSFIEVRNECAHTGSSLNIPTSARLVEYCDLLFTIGAAIVAVLEIKLSESPLGVDINNSGASELSRIPGLGQAKIDALIQYRTTYGRLSKIEDVLKIPGIGKKLFDVIRLHAHV